MKTKKLELSQEDADAFGEYIKKSIEPARSEMHVAVETMKSHLVQALNSGGSIRSMATWLKERKNFQVRADKLRDAVSSVLQESINESQPRSKERASFESALAKLAEDEYGCKKDKAKTDERSDDQSDGRLLLLQQENERLQKEIDDRTDAGPDLQMIERLTSLQQENARIQKELDDRTDEQPDERLEILEKENARLQNELGIASSLQKSLADENIALGKQNPVGALKFYKEGFLELRQMFVDHGHEVPEKLKTPPTAIPPPHTPT